MNIEKLIKVVKLMKHASVGDSDKLKQMAYKFAQMGNYFDRANSARSREILGKEDDQKYAEFYNYGLQVLAQLKQEVEGIKKNAIPANYSRSFDNDTLNLLNDGANRLYWIASDRRDKKGDILSKKILELAKEYKRNAYDSVKDSFVKIKGISSQTAKEYGKKYNLFVNHKAPINLTIFTGDRNDIERMINSSSFIDKKYLTQIVDSVKDSTMTFYGLDKIDKDEEKWFKQKGMQLISQSKDGPGWEYTFRGSKQDLLKYAKEQELDEEEYEIKDSMKDDILFYKGYTIEKTSIFSHKNARYPYVITKHGDIKGGANSIDEAKKKIDKLLG